MAEKRIIIVGGGIVGLASAYEILKTHPGAKVKILEKETKVSQHQTGHNSGVIHSGLYYKPGSLKATNCIHGYNKLLEFCSRENIPFEITGKIVVATEEKELPLLDTLLQRGEENGLKNLTFLSADEMKEIEPHVAGIKGIYVPQTGIIDYTEVSFAYAHCIEKLGGEIHTDTRVKSIRENKKEVIVKTSQGEFRGDLLINCAGLYSDKIAAQIHKKLDIRIIPFRGEYYKLKPQSQHLVNHLIYPVPDPNFPFLGVHFTRMIGGGIEAGPNAVLAFKREGYKKTDFSLSEFSETISWPGFRKVAMKYAGTGLGEMYRSFSKSAFTTALQKLIPEIKESDLVEGGAGVRAQACFRNGTLLDDFYILESDHTIDVVNAPSPAATSSLAIGESIAALVTKRI